MLGGRPTPTAGQQKERQEQNVEMPIKETLLCCGVRPAGLPTNLV